MTAIRLVKIMPDDLREKVADMIPVQFASQASANWLGGMVRVAAVVHDGSPKGADWAAIQAEVVARLASA